jgi:thiamine-monophosphate kinase
MGAEPLGVLIALGAPVSWDAAIDEVLRGVGDACAAAKAPIIGGDTTRSPVLTLGITVLGTATEPMRRDGARVGDAIYLTGSLGGPGAALEAWLLGRTPVATSRAICAPRRAVEHGRMVRRKWRNRRHRHFRRFGC